MHRDDCVCVCCLNDASSSIVSIRYFMVYMCICFDLTLNACAGGIEVHVGNTFIYCYQAHKWSVHVFLTAE